MDFVALVSELQGVGRLGHTSNHQQALIALNEIATTSEIRDFDWQVSAEVNLYKALFHILLELWTNSVSSSLSVEESTVLSLWIKIHAMADYDQRVAGQNMPHSFLQAALDRIVELSCLPIETEGKGHLTPVRAIRIVQHLVLSLYAQRVDLRAPFRSQLTKKLLHTCRGGKVAAQDGGNERVHVSHLLPLLHSIIRGLSDTNKATSYKMELFHKIFLPLHQPNEMVAWRDQVPVLQSYHEELVRCLVALIDSAADAKERHKCIVEIIGKVLSAWPEKHHTNTPKQVLLLHEVEILLERCTAEEFAAIQEPFMRRFIVCIGNEAENIRPAQRALQYFKNHFLVQLFCQVQHSTGQNIVTQMIEALYRKGKMSWNPTVNKMTALALKQLKETDEDIFRLACSLLFKKDKAVDAPSGQTNDNLASDELSIVNGSQPMPPPQRPPLGSIPKPRPRTTQPHTNEIRSYSKDQPPPLTVTGVAPWAMNNAKAVALSSSSSKSMPIPPSNAIKHTVQEQKQSAQHNYIRTAVDPVEAMAAYMVSCFSGVFDLSQDPNRPENKDWNLSQASTSPVFLPSLKFHDIVYGKVLGEGAFSTVKYARQIVKDSGQSSWPEFAVKVMSSEKLLENNYTPLALREIAVLRLLEHPNISRLISYFRYKESIYLVLEYAAKGDLHSFLIENGKLSHELIRFVGGEIVAGLSYLHDLGFSFNDLKPENILITELGHIKLADFGAARPLHQEGKRLLFDSIDALTQLRNGDWKEDDQTALSGTIVGAAIREGSLIAKAQVDERYEGTPAYMPPELFSQHTVPSKSFVGQNNSVLADSWALGCVLYFILHGKPRFYGDIEQVQSQWKLFMQEAPIKVHFTTQHKENYEDIACESLIARLLTPDPSQRPSISSLLNDPYLLYGHLSEHGERIPHPLPIFDPAALYSSFPPVWPTSSTERGKGGAEDIWKRRQFSSLWAPMPKEYNLQHDLQQTVKGYGGGEDHQALSLLSQPLPIVKDDLADSVESDSLHSPSNTSMII